MINQQQPHRNEAQPSHELSAVSWYTHNKIIPAAENTLAVIDSVLSEYEQTRPTASVVAQVPQAVLQVNPIISQGVESIHISPRDAAAQAVEDAFRG